jgi:diguanylate cyclase (GGDEF)-like protein/PAS domain S-box-containing protein
MALLAVVLVILFIFFALYIKAEKSIDHANEAHHQSYLLADELRQSSDDLTRMVRAYVSTGNPIYKKHFQEILDIRDGKKPRPVQYNLDYWDLVFDDDKRPRHDGQTVSLLELMRQAGFGESEFAALERAKIDSDKLTAIEFAAMALIESTKPISDSTRLKAILMLNDSNYRQAKADIMRLINDFNQTMEERTSKAVGDAEQLALQLRYVTILFAFLLAYLLRRTYLTLNDILGCKVAELKNYIARIGSGDFSFSLPDLKGREGSVLEWLAVSQKNLAQLDAARKQAEAALQESEFRWKFAIEGSGDGLWDWNIADNSLMLTHRWKEMLGFTDDEIGTGIDEWEKRIHPEDKEDTIATLQAYFDGKVPNYLTEHRVLCKDGSYKWILDRGMVVSRSVDGKPARMIGTYTDITERKSTQKEIQRLAFYDELTKLPNRRLLIDRLTQVIVASKRSGFYGALIFLDLDNFKSLNDEHGHVAGDLLLIEVAGRLRSCVREMDTVARFGGDEFVVMLSELDADKKASTEQTRHVAEKLLASLSAPYLLTICHGALPKTRVEHHCTASIGVALFIGHECSLDDILRWADTAMYQAKDAGKNQIAFYEK